MGQLPCNGLRADFTPIVGQSIAQGTSVYPSANNAGNNIYQATGFTTPATGWPINEGVAPNWASVAPNFASTYTDYAGIVWTNLGANDCRADVVVVDLLSGH